MLDINFVKNNPEVVKKALQDRQKDATLLDKVLELDTQRRSILSHVEEQRAAQNNVTKNIKGKPTEDQISAALKIKNDLKTFEEQLKAIEAEQKSILEEIPNIPADDVPVGKDDSDNVVLKTVGEIPKVDFKLLDHEELGKKLNIIDKEKAGELCGSRFGYYKNEAAVLEMALMFYAFKKLVSKGFNGMVPPPMIKSTTEWGCGYTSNKNLFNAAYSVPEDDLIFISSSEHSVVPYHTNEILSLESLPIKYVNYSACFRREAGTYGKDMRGMLRLHNFNKVEMNIFCVPDLKVSDAICLEMLAIEEEMLQELELPYQVVKNCTGDLPQPNRRMYDINTWFPGQNMYRETSSCSNCTDYQARRLNTKVKINGKTEYVHILNATAMSDRPLLALIENHQQADGSIRIPEVLWPLTGFKTIAAK